LDDDEKRILITYGIDNIIHVSYLDGYVVVPSTDPAA